MILPQSYRVISLHNFTFHYIFIFCWFYAVGLSLGSGHTSKAIDLQSWLVESITRIPNTQPGCHGIWTLLTWYLTSQRFEKSPEVFSSRFMYHCDVSRGLSLEYKRIVQWDRPLLTLCCLVALTVLIGFFHDYTLPVAVLMLLGVILWCLGKKGRKCGIGI